MKSTVLRRDMYSRFSVQMQNSSIMKINLITAQQLAARLANASPINPIFTECSIQLREIFSKISDQCCGADGKLKDEFCEYFIQFEDHINSAAMEIGEMARMDFMNVYFGNPSKESEVCNA